MIALVSILLGPMNWTWGSVASTEKSRNKQNQEKGFFVVVVVLLFSWFFWVLENIQVRSSHDLAGKMWTNLELKIIGSVPRDKSVVLSGGKTTTKTTNLYLEVWIASEICHAKPVVTGHHPVTLQEIKGPVRFTMGETKLVWILQSDHCWQTDSEYIQEAL